MLGDELSTQTAFFSMPDYADYEVIGDSIKVAYLSHSKVKDSLSMLWSAVMAGRNVILEYKDPKNNGVTRSRHVTDVIIAIQGTAIMDRAWVLMTIMCASEPG